VTGEGFALPQPLGNDRPVKFPDRDAARREVSLLVVAAKRSDC
jgi:hypothetical protein